MNVFQQSEQNLKKLLALDSEMGTKDNGEQNESKGS